MMKEQKKPVVSVAPELVQKPVEDKKSKSVHSKKTKKHHSKAVK